MNFLMCYDNVLESSSDSEKSAQWKPKLSQFKGGLILIQFYYYFNFFGPIYCTVDFTNSNLHCTVGPKSPRILLIFLRIIGKALVSKKYLTFAKMFEI